MVAIGVLALGRGGTRWRLIVLVLLSVSQVQVSWDYERAFWADAHTGSRLLAAVELQAMQRHPGDNPVVPVLDSIGLINEPAPYNLPPVDLWRTRLVLLPRPMPAEPLPHSVLRSIDRPADLSTGQCVLLSSDPGSPISWANKCFILESTTRPGRRLAIDFTNPGHD